MTQSCSHTFTIKGWPEWIIFSRKKVAEHSPPFCSWSVMNSLCFFQRWKNAKNQIAHMAEGRDMLKCVIESKPLESWLLNKSVFVHTDWNQIIHISKYWSVRLRMTRHIWGRPAQQTACWELSPTRRNSAFVEHEDVISVLLQCSTHYVWASKHLCWRGAAVLGWATIAPYASAGTGRAKPGIH